jgi:hypothetical protein
LSEAPEVPLPIERPWLSVVEFSGLLLSSEESEYSPLLQSSIFCLYIGDRLLNEDSDEEIFYNFVSAINKTTDCTLLRVDSD